MEWKISLEYQGLTIREYLQTIHSFSKRFIIAIKFDGGRITVNGQQETVRYQLAVGDLLVIQFPPEKKGNYMTPEEMPLTIFYEDSDIIILDKPAGIATIPSPHIQTGTVANGLLAYYARKDIPYTIHTVTRLDRGTSGLLLIAKHRYSHSLLATSQLAGEVKRKYKAIVEGKLVDKQGVINAPIGRKPGSIIERTVVETGRKAITHYNVEAENQTHSLVDIELETGRTHQIRVHFSHIGHPLAGDDLYGGSANIINRQALHCYELSFKHPTTKKKVSYQLGIPSDMRQLVF